ncbi:MAG: hypothetical protein HY364_00725 [Candidatus Aenigmarchaeota archaeon]|nr:hypothetical protein [Candidatus Aenigmarchaeota archaeon]
MSTDGPIYVRRRGTVHEVVWTSEGENKIAVYYFVVSREMPKDHIGYTLEIEPMASNAKVPRHEQYRTVRAFYSGIFNSDGQPDYNAKVLEKILFSKRIRLLRTRNHT